MKAVVGRFDCLIEKTRGRFVCHILINNEDRINRCLFTSQIINMEGKYNE